MAGLSFHHGVAQAIDAGKLHHINFNDQKPGRFDQNLRFGSERIKQCFFLVKLLEEPGYEGMRHFDAHAYRTEDMDGVRDFARGCMRTYLILKERVRQFSTDAEVQGLLGAIAVNDPELDGLCSGFSPEKAAALAERRFDREEIGRHHLQYERLDQLVVDLLLGVRGQ
jgi:xylose isomerase